MKQFESGHPNGTTNAEDAGGASRRALRTLWIGVDWVRLDCHHSNAYRIGMMLLESDPHSASKALSVSCGGAKRRPRPQRSWFFLPPRLVKWLSLGAAVAIAAAAPASAQRIDSLPIGARVRVQFRHPPPSAYDGVLVAADSLSLTLRASDGSPQVAPFDEIARLEQYAGPISARMGFRRGARTGALIGLGTSAFLMVVASMNPCEGECLMSPTAAAAIVSIPLIGLTTAVGGIIGSQRRELWVPLPNPGCSEVARRSGERPSRCR